MDITKGFGFSGVYWFCYSSFPWFCCSSCCFYWLHFCISQICFVCFFSDDSDLFCGGDNSQICFVVEIILGSLSPRRSPRFVEFIRSSFVWISIFNGEVCWLFILPFFPAYWMSVLIHSLYSFFFFYWRLCSLTTKKLVM